MSGPLEGIRVIELARILAGPWAGQTLADMGAEVIKVEAPQGDDTRRWGPPFVTRPDGTRDAAYFHATNRNKTSVTADFSTAEGQHKLRALIETADILIENFKVGGLAKYGLDYAHVSRLNPRLIYCSITGFGQTGPYAHRAGYDYIIQGMSGLMSVTGPANGAPHKVGVAVTDIVTGIYASSAILAALHERARTGLGQHIDMALMDCAVALMANQAMNYLATGAAPSRLGNFHPNLAPYQTVPCRDGHIIIATGNDAQYRRLCAVLGLDALADHAHYANNADRVARQTELSEQICAQTRNWTSADLLRACEAQGVPAGPINDMQAVFADPQVQSRELALDMDGIKGVRGPCRFSRYPVPPSRPAPALGQDD
ncbi:MAG: CoA transferase [Rhodobacteraceae bacterium]|nr:MAG: CoA transferase [Paracoccaceae bacterium]